MGKLKKEELVTVSKDLTVEPSEAKPVAKPKKKVETVTVTMGDDKDDYKEAVRFLRKKLRGFSKEYFETFVECWKGIKDPQKKAQMYLDAMKILMPAQSVIDIDIGIQQEDSFSTKLRILRDQAESINKKG